MTAALLVEHSFRHEYAQLVAILVRKVGVRHIGFVEDAVQSALDLLDGFAPPAWLAGSYLWDVALADLHHRSGHTRLAEQHRERALCAAPTDAIRQLLARRLGAS